MNIRCLLLAVMPLLFLGCQIRQPVASAITPLKPIYLGPSKERIAEAKQFVLQGISMPVEIDPSGACDGRIEDSELKNLRDRFLVPVCTSPQAGMIEKIEIDASALEWQQWNCRIHLQDLSPLVLSHFGGLYDGRDNQDTDGYRHSRPYVLGELERIAKSTGWRPR